MSNGLGDHIFFALNEIPVGVLILDDNQTVIWTNKLLDTIVGLPKDSYINQHAPSLSHSIFTNLAINDDVITLTAPLISDMQWFKKSCVAYTQENGENWLIYYFQEITEQQTLKIDLKTSAKKIAENNTTDRFTDLLNRRGLIQALETHIETSRRYGNALSIVRMDIVDRRYNELEFEFSEEQFLNAVGQFLKEQLRWADRPGRLDSERFLIILPETDYDSALTIVEKINENLSHLRIKPEAISADVKICYGITKWQKGDDVSRLMSNAENSLEKAKAALTFTVHDF